MANRKFNSRLLHDDVTFELTWFHRMTGEEVNRRKLLSTWSLHFEAKKTHSMDE